MQKHLLYINLFAITSALALSACADEVENAVTPDMPEVGVKTPIELSVGGVDAPAQSSSTRASETAVITDGTNKTMEPFAADTKIFMIMQSDYDTSDHGDYSYGGTTAPDALKVTKYTVARGDVKKKDETEDGMTVVFTGTNQKYWDDAHARSSQLTIWAYAQMSMSWTECSFPEITNGSLSIDDVNQGKFQTNKEIGWQTTQIYPAILSWSVGNPGPDQNATTLIGQDLLFSNNIANYDTDTSNPDSSKDKRLKFDFVNKKFPRNDDVWGTTGVLKTQMKFYHAMSKITIQLKAGDGYKGDGTDFLLKENASGVKTIDKLHGFNTKGLFNIKDGEFQKINESVDIPTIPLINETKNDKTKPYYTLQALVIPNIHEFLYSHSSSDLKSRFVDDAADIMMEFTIDNNKYKITSDMLYEALKSLPEGTGQNQIKKGTYDDKSYIPMEAGKNYIFTFTIGKTAINNISATLAKWTDVEAVEQAPSNAYVTLSLKRDEGTSVESEDPQVDLYRAKDPTTFTGSDYAGWAKYSWATGYTTSGAKATLSQTSTSTIYTAKDATSEEQWYWPNNETYYHFRTINKGLTVASGTNDAVSIYSGSINDTYNATISTAFNDGEFNDYLWGAPFKSSVAGNTVYSPETGFCNAASNEAGQIYKAIGATKDNILLIQHHMMSNIYVDLETTGTDPDAVDLTSATVKIVRFAKDAKIQMGNGLVTGWSYDDGAGIAMTADHQEKVSTGDNPHPEYDYTYRMVPQALSYTLSEETKTVGIEITTADGNVYIINDLSQQKVKGSDSEYITHWLPGKKYYYKFVLKKTGIDKITATVVDWENITADDETVQIQ